MRARVSVFLALPTLGLTLTGCESSRPVDVAASDAARVAPPVAARGPTTPSPDATPTTLPALSGGTSEVLAVNNAGTIAGGYSWERRGTMRAVRWTIQNGSWSITALPHGAGTGAKAAGANRNGDLAGVVYPGTAPHVALWSVPSSFSLLDCNDLGEGTAISADAQIVVGIRNVVAPAAAAVWRPGGCRQNLPPLVTGAWSRADAVSGNGTIVGGTAGQSPSGDGFPVRWKQLAGVWKIEQLDQRRGGVRGSNSAGDLAGYVYVQCTLPDGCQRAMIWYAAGGSRELGTLGGDNSWARGINASGEVVGGSSTASGTATGFLWSASLGMVKLPVGAGTWAAANAVSDVRSDGTRLVVGTNSQAKPIVWVVPNP